MCVPDCLALVLSSLPVKALRHLDYLGNLFILAFSLSGKFAKNSESSDFARRLTMGNIPPAHLSQEGGFHVVSALAGRSDETLSQLI